MMKTVSCVSLLVGLLLPVGSAAAQPIMVSLVPASQEVSEGSTVDVALVISGLGEFAPPSLGTFDIDVRFDPDHLTFQSAAFGNQVDLLGLGSISEVSPGMMKVNVFELSLDTAGDLDRTQAGGFILAMLTFEAGMPGTTPLDVSIITLGDTRGERLTGEPRGAEIGVIPIRIGDLDNDMDVDLDDLTILLDDRGREVADSMCGVRCDLDNNGRITVLDARKLVLRCTREACDPDGDLSILVMAPSQPVELGRTVEVTLIIDGLGEFMPPSLGTFDVELTFDPNVLSFDSASFSDQLDVAGLGSVREVVPGVMNVNLFEISIDNPSNLEALQPGRFVLATLSFNTMAAGMSPLDLVINDVGDAMGDPLEATPVSGSVTITTAPQVNNSAPVN